MKIPRHWRHLFDVIVVLVAREQRSRYKSTLFGVIWAVASPALFLLTFYFLFQVVLKFEVPNYPAYLFIGLIAWTWFQTTTMEAIGCIVGNPTLVGQPGFPRAALPAVATLSNFLTLLLTTPLLIIILVASDIPFGKTLVALPAVAFAQFIVTLSMAYIVAALNVPFRDLQYIVPIILQLGYFATPIFYDTAMLPARAMEILSLNPMLHIIESYRAILIHAEWPDWDALAKLTVISIVGLACALLIFRKASQRFLEDI